RLEDLHDHLAVRQRAELLFAAAAVAQQRRADTPGLEAAAVVADREFKAFVVAARTVQQHGAGLRLAGAEALLRRLDAVTDGIAHQLQAEFAEVADQRLRRLGQRRQIR